MTPVRLLRRSALAAVLALSCVTDTTIGPGAVAALTVVPGTTDVVIADTVRLMAVARNADGVAFVGMPTAWSSSNAAVATVDSAGLVSGVTTGSATITATADGHEATATVSVVTAAVITLSATEAAFTGTPNAPNPSDQTIDITNTGGAALNDLAVATVTYGAGASDWLTASLDRAAAPAVLTLAVDVAGLGAGSYSATVPLTSFRASNSPQSVDVTFDVAPDAPSQMTVQAGNNQSAIAGAAVLVAPAVLVQDQYGNPVPGVAVAFTVTGGGGAVTGAAATTGATGVATVGSWTLGPSAGANSLTARSGGLADVVFSATGVPGSARTIALSSGSGQADTVAATLAQPYVVRVTDSLGNGVSGVTVGWAVPVNQGSITTSSVTNGSGFASATRVLGPTAGTQTATAAVGGLVGSPVNFSATAAAGTAATIAVNGTNGPFGTAGELVTPPPSVIVQDAFGNLKPGVAVTFNAATGNGTITGAAQTTNASGIASVGSWTLGSVRRPDTLTATAAGLAGSPVTIVIRAAWGLAAHVQPQAFALNCVTGCHNVTTGPPPRVGTPLVAYQSLLNGNGTMTIYVTPFDTTDDGGLRTFGTLLYRLKSLTTPMPPSPNNPLAVSNPALYAMIRDWILDGARP